MKYYLMALALVLISGGKQPPEKPVVKRGFNGFPWGTPADSIIRTLGAKPDKRDRSGLAYEQVRYEGILEGKVVYTLQDGKLDGGNFIKTDARKSAYDSLYSLFSNRYGKPTRRVGDITFWGATDTEVSLLMGDRTILANAFKKPPKR